MLAQYFVIWGMHRSGTSLLAAAMRAFGAEPPQDALAADRYNPKGYFESARLVELNENMLRELGLKWHGLSAIGPEQIAILERAGYVDRATAFLEEEAARRPMVLLKDPRMCRLGAIWRQAFARLGISPYSIVTWRDPSAVANSLRIRAQRVKYPSPLTDLRQGLLLWLSGTQSAIKYSVGYRRICVNYDDFLASPRTCLEKIALVFGLPIQEDAAEKFCGDFVDANLNHNAEPQPLLPLPNAVTQLQLQLQQSGDACPEVAQIWPATDEERMVASLLDESNRNLRAYAGKMASVHAEICVLTGECKRMALELMAMRDHQ